MQFTQKNYIHFVHSAYCKPVSVCYNEYNKTKNTTPQGVLKMMNTALFMNLIDRYNHIAYTHEYIWGFEYKGNIYMAITDSSVMAHICKLDKASRGCGYALRFCPTTDQKLALLPNATLLCSKKYFEEAYAASKYNRGEIFEKMVTEYFGQEWHKDTVPFWEAGDITLDGKEVQIKLDSATLMNTKHLEKWAA